MKKLFCLLLVFSLALFAAEPLFAFTETPVDLNEPSSVVAYLSTFIVLIATWVVKLAKPSIPGWATVLVVAGLSSGLAFLTNALGNPELSWWAQFGLGLAATFVHQISVQFSASKR